MKRVLYGIGGGFMIFLLFLIMLPAFTHYRIYDVSTGSMVPAIPVGSIALVDTDERTPVVGETIAFTPPDVPNQVFTHHVAFVYPNGDFLTRGEALTQTDPWTATKSDVVGKVVAVFPFAGWIIDTLRWTALATLAAVIVRYCSKRFLAHGVRTHFLISTVVTSSFIYLFDILKPLVGADAVFVPSRGKTLAVHVINYGWIPLRAFPAGHEKEASVAVAGNSVKNVVFAYSKFSQNLFLIRMKPALTLEDWAVLILVMLCPIALIAIAFVISDIGSGSRHGPRAETGTQRHAPASRKRTIRAMIRPLIAWGAGLEIRVTALTVLIACRSMPAVIGASVGPRMRDSPARRQKRARVT